jgi:hypothetical protein
MLGLEDEYNNIKQVRSKQCHEGSGYSNGV